MTTSPSTATGAALGACMMTFFNTSSGPRCAYKMPANARPPCMLTTTFLRTSVRAKPNINPRLSLPHASGERDEGGPQRDGGECAADHRAANELGHHQNSGVG